MRVKSKIDRWLSILIWSAVCVMSAFMLGIPENERLIGYSVGAVSLAFILWIYFDTYYELRDDYLYCRSGPFFEKIPYDKIKSVKLSQNLLSSMALSSKRIKIRQHDKGYFTGTTYISPIGREEFMAELLRRCKNLNENARPLTSSS